MSNGGGPVERNMIGMARLSCNPCRRRKSKCDREEPCSSCKLRSTEQFCYTSETEGTNKTKGTQQQQGRRSDRSPQTASNGATAHSPPLSSTASSSSGTAQASRNSMSNGSSSSHKRVRVDDGPGSAAVEPQSSPSLLKSIESLEDSLYHLRKAAGIDTKASLEGLSALPSEVRWGDVAHILPPREDCEIIIEYFFSDAYWQSSILHKGVFHKKWKKLIDGEPVSRTFIAILCCVVAQTLLLAPSYHAASRLPCQAKHYDYLVSALDIMLVPHNVPFETVTTLDGEELQMQCLVIVYLSFSGRAVQAWQEVGKAARMGKLSRLFEEERWGITGLSDWEIEIRRRSSWYLCEHDWWLSLYLQLSPLSPDWGRDISVNWPKYFTDEAYDVDTGALVTMTPSRRGNYSWEHGKHLTSCCARRVNQFQSDIRSMRPEERYREAREVDSFLQRIFTSEWPEELRFDQSSFTTPLTEPESARRIGQTIILHTSKLRLRCMVMRQFLLDPNAPVDLRIGALEQARRIIELTNIIVSLSSSPHSSFSSTWCSGHLFCAAATFAIVYLGESEPDLQDLNWFASKIFEVIEALSFLSTKDFVAKRCEELLTALCTSRDWLKERFRTSNSGRYRQGKVLRSGMDRGLERVIAGADLDILDAVPIVRENRGGSLSVKGTSSPGSSAPRYPTSQAQMTSSPATLDAIAATIPDDPLPGQTAALEGDATTPASARSDSFDNWALLDEQQWFSLLNTLEQDMDTFTSNTKPPLLS